MDKVDQRRRTVVLQCSAILFDMDGTLVDSTSVVERQWKAFAEKYNLDYEHIMRVSHGRRNTETIREIAPHLATPEVFAEFDAAELDDRQGVTAVKGAAKLLAQLVDREWAVVTSASRALARNRLKTVHLPVPTVLIGADDVREGKPDPEGYLLAARRLGVERGFCVVFEDTLPGLEAGRSAQMHAIGITTTYGHTKLAPADCIADFSEVEIERTEQRLIRLRLQCF
jgi:mannitol-1-/sugar-/sorbitol-6-phosphatase